jgi:hypothetical protein
MTVCAHSESLNYIKVNLKMKPLLFIYNNTLDGSYGGSQRTKQAKKGLENYFDLILYSCSKKNNKILTFIYNCLFYSGSLFFKDTFNILQIIKNNHRKLAGIYFDVSLHGVLVKKIKRIYPNIPVIVNYHNYERKYFKDLVKSQGFLYTPLFFSAWYNETLSKNNGDYHVFITQEDKENIGKIKGQYTIVPPMISDNFSPERIKNSYLSNPYILFIGAALYANIQGARFIIEKIAPNITVKCIIAGKGMRKVFNQKNILNVEIFDFVDDLSSLFCNASAFISPLFSGSGAKVKIAEALMYGKKILGSRLSFLGYKKDEEICIECNNASEFIKNINLLNINKKYYKQARNLYCKNYSDENIIRYYKSINDFLIRTCKE